jgi:hypothetical protein
MVPEKIKLNGTPLYSNDTLILVMKDWMFKPFELSHILFTFGIGQLKTCPKSSSKLFSKPCKSYIVTLLRCNFAS